MRVTLPRLVSAALAIYVVAQSALAAEGVKLRPMAPIYVDAAGSGIQKPEGVGCNGTNVVVADTGNARLLRYTVSGDSIVAGAAIVLPQLPYPTHVDINSEGEIFVVDRKLRRVARVSAGGEFLEYLDLGGAAARVGAVPRSVEVGRDDRVWVLDTYSGRIVVLSPEGAIEREIAFPREYGFLADIAVDDLGGVYAIDSVERRILHAERGQGRLVPLTESMREEMDFPASIAADSGGRLFVADQNGGGIVIFDRDGSYRGRQSAMGWREGYLRYPSALCLDTVGDLFVADRENNRVQAFFVVQ